ncbi:hypothetical protein OG985_45430 [Streptomyces sp. NBC_00289]|uniref:hypothetical protein n=1 Tax=Streptomyces sp. NBC_00289 TaxID=2975703 RepID=UPI003246FA6B
MDVLEALSQALFCTSLGPDLSSSVDEIRSCVLHQLGSDLDGSCARHVAGAAGTDAAGHDRRMAWCRQMIRLAFYSQATPRSA